MKKADRVHLLVRDIEAAGLPAPELEYVFAPRDEAGKPIRRWRFDLAWPEQRIAAEIEGALFVGGRHGGTGSTRRDLEKYNVAACLGWRLVRLLPEWVGRPRALQMIEIALGQRSVGELL